MQIEQINSRHERILDLIIAGNSQAAVASLLGLTPSHVSVIINSPCFQHELSLRRARLQQTIDSQIVDQTFSIKQAEETLKAGAFDAATKLLSLVNSDNESIARQSATDILDRVGLPKAQKIDSTSRLLSINLSPDDLDRITSTLSQLKNNAASCERHEVVQSANADSPVADDDKKPVPTE